MWEIRNIYCRGGIYPSSQTVEKPLAGFSDKLWQPAACIICPPVGDKFHTCSLRCVFCQVHAPAENGLDSICRQWRQTLRGFFDKLRGEIDPSSALCQEWEKTRRGEAAFAVSPGDALVEESGDGLVAGKRRDAQGLAVGGAVFGGLLVHIADGHGGNVSLTL